MQDGKHTPDNLIPVSAVAEILQRSRASIYRDIKSGAFPKPLKLGNSSRWRRSEIDAYINGLAEGRDCD